MLRLERAVEKAQESLMEKGIPWLAPRCPFCNGILCHRLASELLFCTRCGRLFKLLPASSYTA